MPVFVSWHNKFGPDPFSHFDFCWKQSYSQNTNFLEYRDKINVMSYLLLFVFKIYQNVCKIYQNVLKIDQNVRKLIQMFEMSLKMLVKFIKMLVNFIKMLVKSIKMLLKSIKMFVKSIKICVFLKCFRFALWISNINLHCSLDIGKEIHSSWLLIYILLSSLIVLQEKNRGADVSTRICKSMNQDKHWSNTSLYFSMMVLSRIFLTFCLGKNYH